MSFEIVVLEALHGRKALLRPSGEEWRSGVFYSS